MSLPMDSKVDAFVSVIALLHNNAEILPQFLRDLSAVLESNYTNYEIVLIDDASDDDTCACVKQLLARHKCVRFIPLSRQMGQEIALAAGLESAIGDYVVTIDPDFDPPDEIVTMV